MDSTPLKLEVASPCTMRWEEMSGDARRRHCAACHKNVYDLSRMTRAEIDALIVTTEGRFCGRLFTRPAGTVLTADCPVGLRERLARAANFTRAAWAALVAGTMSLFGYVAMGADAPARRDPQPVARLPELAGLQAP